MGKKDIFFQVLGLSVFPNLRYSPKCFAQTQRGHDGGALCPTNMAAGK